MKCLNEEIAEANNSFLINMLGERVVIKVLTERVVTIISNGFNREELYDKFDVELNRKIINHFYI
jgi:hypothetical protein